ncbi:unnamed protein product [Adineta ricciae]|uniref:Uncharacterized protein n=1 Tax=Adineta ricciae TaxID=249248 RepID=A0A816F6Y1_ADIRI|nr:unnamed protein product [Adineta ricciae]
MYQHSESNTECMKQISLQCLSNEIFDELDGLLAEHINESEHFIAFDDVKKKLRQLFNRLEERIYNLEKQVTALQSSQSV